MKVNYQPGSNNHPPVLHLQPESELDQASLNRIHEAVPHLIHGLKVNPLKMLYLYLEIRLDGGEDR